jgi:hypothetical protein
MQPPVFTICNASTAVKALLGADPVRLYPGGIAPQGVAAPYAVWQTITGQPDNSFENSAETDDYSVQIDIYAATSADSVAVARAMRTAFEGSPDSIVVGSQPMPRETVTDLFRYMLSVDFIVSS